MEVKQYCIKCGYNGADIKYVGEYSDRVVRRNLIEDVLVEPSKLLNECLKITCKRCGYVWREDVLTPEVGEGVDGCLK